MAEIPDVALPTRGRRWPAFPYVQIGLFCSAALLEWVLLLTYGRDLSPGLF